MWEAKRKRWTDRGTWRGGVDWRRVEESGGGVDGGGQEMEGAVGHGRSEGSVPSCLPSFRVHVASSHPCPTPQHRRRGVGQGWSEPWPYQTGKCTATHRDARLNGFGGAAVRTVRNPPSTKPCLGQSWGTSRRAQQRPSMCPAGAEEAQHRCPVLGEAYAMPLLISARVRRCH